MEEASRINEGSLRTLLCNSTSKAKWEIEFLTNSTFYMELKNVFMRKSKKCHLLLTYGYQGYLQHGPVTPIQDVSKLPTNPVHGWAGYFTRVS